MAAAPQTSSTSPFDLSNQGSKSAALGRSTIIWLVVLACIIATAFIIVACLLCRCRRRKHKNVRVSRGYSIHDGRNDYHPWNKHAAPMPPPPPAYGGYGDVKDVKSTVDQTSIAVPSQATMRPSAMEPMVAEEAGNDAGFRRSNNRKTSRYYGGLSARFSRMSQIGRAM